MNFEKKEHFTFLMYALVKHHLSWFLHQCTSMKVSGQIFHWLNSVLWNLHDSRPKEALVNNNRFRKKKRILNFFSFLVFFFESSCTNHAIVESNLSFNQFSTIQCSQLFSFVMRLSDWISWNTWKFEMISRLTEFWCFFHIFYY